MALKLPSLWPDNPAKWFLHYEGKFRLHRIVSQQTMFDHCLHAMSAEQSDVVKDLMEKGLSDNAYAELKATYLERRTPTTAERVQRLHALVSLGYQRPSGLLHLVDRILGRTIQGDEISTEEFLTIKASWTNSTDRPCTSRHFHCGTDVKNGRQACQRSFHTRYII